MGRRGTARVALLAAAVWWPGAGCQCQCEKPPPARARPDAKADPWHGVDEFIDKKMKDASIPGLATAVIHRDRLLWSAAYGWADVQDRRPVTVDTAFLLASTSKTVTAVALMQLWQQGKLDFERDVNAYLPFKVDNPRLAGETITVRHLTTHTAGIRDDPGVLDEVRVGGDSPIALRSFLQQYLVAGGRWYHEPSVFYPLAPGRKWRYSNVASALAGYLVESVAGVPFDEYCNAHIFDPLGMTMTRWYLADFARSQLAMPHRHTGDGYEPYGHYSSPEYPAGGLRSSVDDLAHFLMAIANGGRLGKTRILERQTVERMLSPQLPEVRGEQCVLWMREQRAGRTLVGHSGQQDGAAAIMFFAPDTGVGVIVLINVDWSGAVVAAIEGIEALLYDRGEAVIANEGAASAAAQGR